MRHLLTDPVPLKTSRWHLENAGIAWEVASDPQLPHHDHLEMSGYQVSTVIHFGANAEGNLYLEREVIWPMLRLRPNNTYGSLGRGFDDAFRPRFEVDGKTVLEEILYHVGFDGLLQLRTRMAPGLAIQRTLFPCRDHGATIENYVVTNGSGAALKLKVTLPAFTEDTQAECGAYGSYRLTARLNAPIDAELESNGTIRFSLVVTGEREGMPVPPLDGPNEETLRRRFVEQMQRDLQLETPEPILNRMFSFAKVRTSESIFKTKGGLMHSPGGGLKDEEGKAPRPGLEDKSNMGRYYAAIWANDQAEYAGPFFPYLGYETGNEASLNAYRHFAAYLNPEYRRLPFSIIAEGDDFWDEAGDRGDAAMISYGASRFALAGGKVGWAEELWPLIEWCLEYCHRQVNSFGVVGSDTDELEGRLPAGNANLHTSVLTYDALLSAAYLAKALNKGETLARTYNDRAVRLRAAIESYFGANVEGFDSYRYYDGNTQLRAWICSPLIAEILERKDGTIAALTSPRLWTADGLSTVSGRKDFWDRSTLYALRGIFYASEADLALPALRVYSQNRLLGERVPYPVEAYPEGGQSHLAGESALYARIYIEGLFGIRPTGLGSFSWKPSLPSSWPEMALRRVKAFGKVFDLTVKRSKDGLRLRVDTEGQAPFTSDIVNGMRMDVVFR